MKKRILLCLLASTTTCYAGMSALEDQIEKIKNFKGQKQLQLGRMPHEGSLDPIDEAAKDSTLIVYFSDSSGFQQYTGEEPKFPHDYVFLKHNFNDKDIFNALKQNGITFDKIIFDWSTIKFFCNDYVKVFYDLSNSKTQCYADLYFDCISDEMEQPYSLKYFEGTFDELSQIRLPYKIEYNINMDMQAYESAEKEFIRLKEKNNPSFIKKLKDFMEKMPSLFSDQDKINSFIHENILPQYESHRQKGQEEFVENFKKYAQKYFNSVEIIKGPYPFNINPEWKSDKNVYFKLSQKNHSKD